MSIKVSAYSPTTRWGFEEVDHGAARSCRSTASLATPGQGPEPRHGVRSLDLTIAVFTAILDQPDMRGYEAGIVLQAY